MRTVEIDGKKIEMQLWYASKMCYNNTFFCKQGEFSCCYSTQNSFSNCQMNFLESSGIFKIRMTCVADIQYVKYAKTRESGNMRVQIKIKLNSILGHAPPGNV